MSTKSKDNILWIDLIKVFSTFLIVLQHSISRSFMTLPLDSLEWKVTNFIFMISRMGVPIFVMCSGIGMLARERSIKEIWQKSIFGLVKVYVGWMAVFGIWDVIRIWINGEHATVRVMVNAFIKAILFGRYHTWFLWMLIGLYAITPFLYLIVQKREYLSYFLLLSVLFSLILPIISRFEQLSRLQEVIDSVHMQFVVGYSLYFLVGYYIYHCMDDKWEKYVEIIFALTAVLACGLSIFVSGRTGAANQEAYDLFSPCGFLLACCLLISFKKYIGEKKESRLLNQAAKIQKYGIAVYLIHVMFVELWISGGEWQQTCFGRC